MAQIRDKEWWQRLPRPFFLDGRNPQTQSEVFARSGLPSWTAKSNSRKNESQGSGMVLLGCVGKVFFPQISNQVPVGRYWRAVFTEPGALSIGH